MNIFIITQDDPFYLPVFFNRVIGQLKDYIVGVTILSESKSPMATLKKFYRFYGPWLFIVTLFWYFVFKVSDVLSAILPIKKLHSVERICRRNQIRVYDTKNINSPEFIENLKTTKTDIVVSVAAPQIFKSELINTPPLGCINVHGAPLPRYRGMMPSFWMLLNGETKGAVSVHFMDEAVDSGDIILQKEYTIDPNMTHHEVIIRSKKAAAALLIEALAAIREDRVVRRTNDKSQATYYSFPKKEDLIKFRQAGKRLR